MSFLDWSLNHFLVSFLISYNLHFKVYFFFDIRIATQAFFCFPFAWNIFFHPLTFSLYVSLGLKLMAPHSSTLAWKIPWMEEPGRLQSMGSLRVRHDWTTSLSLFTFMHWRRKWQPTPVFLPGGSQGQGSLVGCCLWGHTESDTTEAT